MQYPLLLPSQQEDVATSTNSYGSSAIVSRNKVVESLSKVDGASSSPPSYPRDVSIGCTTGGGLTPSPREQSSVDDSTFSPTTSLDEREEEEVGSPPHHPPHQGQKMLFATPPPLPALISTATAGREDAICVGEDAFGDRRPAVHVFEGARSSSLTSTAAISMPDVSHCGGAINGEETYGEGSNPQKRLLENSDYDFPPPDEIPMSPTTEQKTMRSAFFAVFPVFMAYAALVTLQGNLKQRIGISNDDSSESFRFSFATSLCYLGNLIFRLLHNILFSKLTPRHRVCISYVCLACSMFMLGIVYFAFDDPDNKALSKVSNLAPVYVAYLLGGVAIGTFESNLLSVITPLGHGTKVWAQYGIPIGFNGISVGAFILLASLPEVEVQLQATIYCTVGGANILGLIFFLRRIPDVPFESTSTSLLHFFHDLRRFKEWVPLVWTFAAALAVDMFAVSLCSALQQFIYQSSSLPLFSFGSSGMRAEVIPRNVHRAAFNGASLIGDTVGRKLAYRTSKHIHPLWFLIATVLGVTAVLSKQPLIAPFGMLLVMFANGSVYAHTTKYIDDCVDRRYNLIALSFWLFIGDAGSFVGANVVSPLRSLVGGD